MLANSAPYINGKQRYAVNSVSYTDPDTPLKLADHFNIGGVFNLGSISDQPYNGNAYIGTPVMAANFRSYVEIIFQNWENTVQSWHIDGYSFFVVGYIIILPQNENKKKSLLIFIKITIFFLHLVLVILNLSLWMNRMDGGQWTPANRAHYNLRDTIARCTVQVCQNSKHIISTLFNAKTSLNLCSNVFVWCNSGVS